MKYNVQSITSDNRTEFAGLTEVETKINSKPRNILSDTIALTVFIYYLHKSIYFFPYLLTSFGVFCLKISPKNILHFFIIRVAFFTIYYLNKIFLTN
jgi:hypothetical protein